MMLSTKDIYLAEHERRAHHKIIFGHEDFTTEIKKAIAESRLGAGMIAMSILSDAQELISRGRIEDGRQLINQAKHVIAEYTMSALSEKERNAIEAGIEAVRGAEIDNIIDTNHTLRWLLDERRH